jgi:cytoskeletal protein RodZ
VASFDIGAKLRQERVGQGLTTADIARDTRIPLRFLEAIEEGDFTHLPGLIFARNFVRQYALALKLDPDPLLAELPKQDESTAQLPDPPARQRSSYHRDRALRSTSSSLAWVLLAGGAVFAAYINFNHTPRAASVAKQATPPAAPSQAVAEQPSSPSQQVPQADPDASKEPQPTVAATAAPAASADSSTEPLQAPPAVVDSSAPVQVSMIAHEASWVQITADGKPAFTGTLQSNETKQIAATEQVRILTGNAGGLTISLNGKTLDSLGPSGQIRSVKLTAEGPEVLSRPRPPAYDPL